jgi:hypothetical protein
MNSARAFRDDAFVSRAADGSLVVVLHLTEEWEASDLRDLVEDARAFNARAVWIFGGEAIDPALGFRPTGGYMRLEAPEPPAPLLLTAPPSKCVRELQTTCFSGVWGRYEAVSRDPASRYVGLYERGRWTGICQVDVIAGWIDGPGIHPMLRTPERSAQLVRGAAAYLPRNLPVNLETWGESDATIDAYRKLGFEVIEKVPGWELRLSRR